MVFDGLRTATMVHIFQPASWLRGRQRRQKKTLGIQLDWKKERVVALEGHGTCGSWS